MEENGSRRDLSFDNYESAVYESNTVAAEDFWVKYRYRDIIDETSDPILGKAKNLLRTWSEQIHVDPITSSDGNNVFSDLDLEDPYLEAKVQSILNKKLKSQEKCMIEKQPAFKYDPRKDPVVKRADDILARSIPTPLSDLRLSSTFSAVKLHAPSYHASTSSTSDVHSRDQFNRLQHQKEWVEMRMRQEKEKEKEMAKKAQLAEARLIAENRFLIYAMKALRLSFNAWQESVAMTRLRTHQHQGKYFHLWKRNRKKRITHRQVLLQQVQLAHENENLSRASQIHRKKLERKILSLWISRYSEKREEESLKAFQAAIVRKKAQILSQATEAMTQKQQQVVSVSIDVGKSKSEEDTIVQTEVKLQTNAEADKKMTPLRSLQRPSKLIEGMKKREEERQERKEKLALIKKEKERLEKEKKEKELLYKQEEERLKRLRKLEEVKRKEEERKKEESRKAEERKQRLADRVKAKVWNQKSICTWSYNRWKQIIESRSRKEILAGKVHQQSVIRCLFSLWASATQMAQEKRRVQADQFHQLSSISRSWGLWRSKLKQMRDQNRILLKAAQRLSLGRAFQLWRKKRKLKFARLIEWELSFEKSIIFFQNRRYTKLAFANWKAYVKISKEIRWREYRRDAMRNRAKELLVYSKLNKDLEA